MQTIGTLKNFGCPVGGGYKLNFQISNFPITSYLGKSSGLTKMFLKMVHFTSIDFHCLPKKIR